MKSVINPVSSSNRIVLLDILRGFAIFGILMVNMQIFFRPLTSIMVGYTGTGGLTENMPEIFIKFFFEGKFYLLFSMLFGYGFYMFINKPGYDEGIVIPVFKKRLFILLLIGIIHVVFIWAGDILVFYALIGFILLIFRKKSNRKIIKWAVWLALVPVILTVIGYMLLLPGSVNPGLAEEIQHSLTERSEYINEFVIHASNVYAKGSFFEIMKIRLSEYIKLLPGIIFFYPMVLSMFLIGYLAARSKLITNFKVHITIFRRALWWGMVIGVAFSALYTLAYFKVDPFTYNLWILLIVITNAAGGFFLCVFYVSAIVLLHDRSRFWSFKFLAPVGKMALTNYLLQSIVCTMLFYSYGFGLFGQITNFQGILISFIIYGLQILFSLWWLKKFYYGPFEWLWRSLTYMKRQPFKRNRLAV